MFTNTVGPYVIRIDDMTITSPAAFLNLNNLNYSSMWENQSLKFTNYISARKYVTWLLGGKYIVAPADDIINLGPLQTYWVIGNLENGETYVSLDPRDDHAFSSDRNSAMRFYSENDAKVFKSFHMSNQKHYEIFEVTFDY